jgi:general secretion pathway protein G
MVTARKISTGFTLIELLVTLAIIATLIALVSPRYFHSIDKAKEVALKTNLAVMRDALDKFYTDQGQYPQLLEQLVTARYLREIPKDPVLDANQQWLLIGHPGGLPGIYDIKSTAPGISSTGTPFSQF